MGRLYWPGGALAAPLPPALVACGMEEENDCNVLTIAWTGIINTVPPKTYISVRPKRHSYALLKKYGEFTINLPTASLLRAVDSCGVYTGAKMNKFERFGLHPERADKVSAPIIAECPLALECRVTDVIPLGSHDMFLAEVVNVQADDAYINPETGRFELERARPITYMHGHYDALGKQIGRFGWTVQRKRKKTK